MAAVTHGWHLIAKGSGSYAQHMALEEVYNLFGVGVAQRERADRLSGQQGSRGARGFGKIIVQVKTIGLIGLRREK